MPPSVKELTIFKHGIKDSIWIETGTFMGRKTAFLTKRFPLVHKIEPSKYCLKFARINTSKFKNINFHHGTSEECLEGILEDINRDVSFWLDGHFSGGVTFEGEKHTLLLKMSYLLLKKILKTLNRLLFVLIISTLR